MEYLGLIILILWLADLLKTKRAGMYGFYKTKEEDPLGYYAFVAIAVFAVIFGLLYVLGFFES